MKIVVCGGQTFGDIATLQRLYPLTYQQHPLWHRRQDEYDFVFRTLDYAAVEFSKHYDVGPLPWSPQDLTIISGCANGADSVAIDWARARGAQLKEYPANWEKYGRGAGVIRNQEMVDTQPDLVISFPGHRGTLDMLTRARKAKIEVRLMTHRCVETMMKGFG